MMNQVPRFEAFSISHQYRKHGIVTFARRYAAGSNPIEQGARTKARRVVQRL